MNSEDVKVLGVNYKIVFEEKKFLKDRVIFESEKIRVFKGELSNLSHSQILRSSLIKIAKKEIVKRTKELASLYGFEFNQIRIKETRSRWGSCSSLRNLNFNWKLILLSSEQMDYVICHELAHLKHMNHGKFFWEEVSLMVPNYKVLRKSIMNMQ